MGCSCLPKETFPTTAPQRPRGDYMKGARGFMWVLRTETRGLKLEEGQQGAASCPALRQSEPLSSKATREQFRVWRRDGAPRDPGGDQREGSRLESARQKQGQGQESFPPAHLWGGSIPPRTIRPMRGVP